MTTDTDVIVTQYRAQFRSEPFAPGSGRWRIAGGMEYKTVLAHRRRWTVAREFDSSKRWLTQPAAKSDTYPNVGHIHVSMLMDPDAVVVFVPDTAGARFGTAIVLEQIARHNRCVRCSYLGINQPDMHSHILRNHS